MITAMLAPSCGAMDANGSNVELMTASSNHSLNTGIGRSFCSPENVSKMIFERRDLVSRISFDMQKIGWDLAHTTMEVQQQKLRYHRKINLVMMDCRQAVLCINTFSLKTVLKTKVAQDVG